MKTGETTIVKKVYEMIPANLDKKVKIKKVDETFIHTENVKAIILPKDPLHPIYEKRIQVFDVDTFERFFNTGDENENATYLRAMGDISFRIVHDPRLTEKN
jgi:hypothetical protein